MRSLAQALRRPGGEWRGGATIRLLLVAVLVAAQSIEVSEGASQPLLARAWLLAPLGWSGLGASLGFAAARHRETAGWRASAGRWLRRAVPVYAFAIVAGAFVLGTAITDVGRRSYLTDPDAFAYLLNLVAVPRYELPGVFEFNPVPRVVNAVVWVAPISVFLLLVASLPSRGAVGQRLPAIIVAVVTLVALVGEAVDADATVLGDFAMLVLNGNGLSLILGALIGMAASRDRERVPAGDLATGVAAALLVTIAILGRPGWLDLAAFRIVVAVPSAYLALVLSTRRLFLGGIAWRVERYLPGTLLFAYPLQQLLVERGPDRQDPLVNLALAAPAAMLLAAAFWHGGGRWLAAREDRAGPARAAALFAGRAGRGSRPARSRRGQRVPLLANLALTVLLGLVFISIMAMLFIALQPGADA